ncbi:unnamed protein product [Didymodactylos carnosus]|uniref:Arsenite methyltransferase n=1 Tax=Didymodactylos carnosus TaxID=1234261 RepID=A0A813VZZ3_9BILA|nr:unnamed protein product [Didymodactylos carnosus]CAF1211182.1 unnamed protein product [Didymodactylos carnosus]CAF3631094.1 unnamed protein product [Didymodactylos carnosus]CAF4020009.1 unnamed protein product [Didymodactylos carnosus]
MANYHSNVQDYYSKELKSTYDLKTSACCTKGSTPHSIKSILKDIHPDVQAKYYGCGLVFPPKLENCKVLDLGCGSGRDVYILSRLVGPQGFVVGVDMTKEQIDVARQHIDYHMKKFNYKESNVKFIEGKIENLTALGINENFFDVVVSNCVINLTPDKKAVINEVWKVLKPGGEFYFSDVYADQTISEDLRNNKILWGECLSGAIKWEDLVLYATEAGFTTPRLVTAQQIDITNDDLKKLVGTPVYFSKILFFTIFFSHFSGNIRFVSATFRLFKIPLNEAEINIPYLLTYESGIPDFEDAFLFDNTITFKRGELVSCGPTLASAVLNSRYRDNFTFEPIDNTKQYDGQIVIVEEQKERPVFLKYATCQMLMFKARRLASSLMEYRT